MLRSQPGINQVLSEENGPLTGKVKDQVTAAPEETSVFLHCDDTTRLRAKHERYRTSVASDGQRGFRNSLLHFISSRGSFQDFILDACLLLTRHTELEKFAPDSVTEGLD